MIPEHASPSSTEFFSTSFLFCRQFLHMGHKKIQLNSCKVRLISFWIPSFGFHYVIIGWQNEIWPPALFAVLWWPGAWTHRSYRFGCNFNLFIFFFFFHPPEPFLGSHCVQWGQLDAWESERWAEGGGRVEQSWRCTADTRTTPAYEVSVCRGRISLVFFQPLLLKHIVLMFLISTVIWFTAESQVKWSKWPQIDRPYVMLVSMHQPN